MLYPARLADRTGTEPIQPLVPAILCAFAFDSETETFLPEMGVRACLDQVGPRGFRTHCHGLWARRLAGDPGLATHTFSWLNLGEYRQPRLILGIEGAYMQRVPVRYLRWFDGPDGLPIPEGPLRDTLALITLDWPATGGDADPLGAVFTATTWRADTNDGWDAPLTEMPSQLGVDTATNVLRKANAIERLRTTRLVVTALPYDSDAPATPVDLHRPCSFVFRYYSPRRTAKTLRADEAAAMSWAGLPIAVVWEGHAVLDQGWEPYVNDLIEPFVEGHGRQDGLRAFTYAAGTIVQPPYTPIYFAIDFPVGTDYLGVDTPPMETIVSYFHDLHRGYRDYLTTYLETHATAPPYYVGVYGEADACAALYRAGLATHFWQVAWATWGNGRRPFAHLNAWQVGVFDTQAVQDDNRTLMNTVEVDLDVAWGDPGSFQVFL
jgi:hypothetical protein